MHLFLTFSAALGIARTSSALHSLARKLAAARHNPSKLGFCSRLAQTFLKMRLLAKLIVSAKHQRGTRPTARPSLFMAFHT